ncbi:Nodulation efficiency protein D related protein (nefD) [Thermococcus sp. 4557]|uniref:NfeD family protein n=1 Tax=Thermococcus sp. (strain CGMCC 1.5172 / 4557) TaxID=1042877 RepID=UPI000219E8AF|nr:NfeD family protein [Thermococcus sp. 4557]AEK73814.1 Nodulation efficiency protein D related protein (nefD) [Thermococcus sp. 4557]
MDLRDVLKLLALMADEIIVGVFIFLILPEIGVEIPLWAGLLVIAALLAKDFLIAPFVLGGGANKKPEVGPERLIGRTALVVEDLSPEGVVKLDGELWKAECLNGTAGMGEKVKIVSVMGTKVLVERRG